MNVKNDHRSKFSNLSSWKEEAWKKSGLQRDSNPWPPQYRCDALTTELWSHTLGARSIKWVHWPCSQCSSVGRALHRYCEGHGFESPWSPDFFRLLLSNCLSWKIYCDDHSLRLVACVTRVLLEHSPVMGPLHTRKYSKNVLSVLSIV